MIVKTKDEIKSMEKAGKLAARTLEYAETLVKAGVTTLEIDQAIHEFVLSKGAIPAPLNYHGYPKSICTSVNHVICHGVPDSTVLRDGDIINVDVTCIVEGFHGDTSRTYFVGTPSEKARAIVDCAEKAMYKGIEAVMPGGTTGDIGFAINKFVTKMGYHVVREIGGHGIGRKFHEEPFVPSYGKKGRGDMLRPWGTITVEPMINETAAPIKELPIPGSTIKYYETSDKTLSAQFEHTVLITDTGYELLTVP